MEELLRLRGAVSIQGPKYSGMSTTMMRKAKRMVVIDHTPDKDTYLESARLAPDCLLAGETPRLIDEW